MNIFNRYGAGLAGGIMSGLVEAEKEKSAMRQLTIAQQDKLDIERLKHEYDLKMEEYKAVLKQQENVSAMSRIGSILDELGEGGELTPKQAFMLNVASGGKFPESTYNQMLTRRAGIAEREADIAALTKPEDYGTPRSLAAMARLKISPKDLLPETPKWEERKWEREQGAIKAAAQLLGGIERINQELVSQGKQPDYSQYFSPGAIEARNVLGISSRDVMERARLTSDEKPTPTKPKTEKPAADPYKTAAIALYKQLSNFLDTPKYTQFGDVIKKQPEEIAAVKARMLELSRQYPELLKLRGIREKEQIATVPSHGEDQARLSFELPDFTAMAAEGREDEMDKYLESLTAEQRKELIDYIRAGNKLW